MSRMRLVTAAQNPRPTNGSNVSWPPPSSHFFDGAGWSVSEMASSPMASTLVAKATIFCGSSQAPPSTSLRSGYSTMKRTTTSPLGRGDAGAAFPSIHYPSGGLIHAGLEATADRMPERIAVTFDDEACSFREIDALSNAMARLLLELGVRPGQRVGIMAMNRPEFVIALFAVLKAGAALVSLSTAWKDVELGHAVELTEPSFVIHDGTVAELLHARL